MIDRTRARFVSLVLAWVLVFSWFVGGQAMAAEEPTTTTSTSAPATTAAPAVPLADQVDDNPSIAVGGEGFDGLVPSVRLAKDGDVLTLAERFPGSAYTWDSSYGKTEFTDPAIQHFLADPALRILVGWGTLVTRTMTWVWTVPQISTGLIDSMNRAVRDSGLWQAAGLALIFATGVYVVVMAVWKMRSLEAVQHVLWVCVLGVFSYAVLMLPGATIGRVNEASGNLARYAMGAMSTADPGAEVPDGTVQRPTFTGDKGTDAVRRAQDVWWRLFVVIPWATGELGRVDDTIPPGTIDHILALKSGDVANMTEAERKVYDGKALTLCKPGEGGIIDAIKGVSGVMESGVKSGPAGVACMRQEQFRKYRDDVLEALPGVDPWINGKNPAERALIGWAALAIAIPSGALMIGLSLFILWCGYKGVIWLMASPVYALRGMVAGTGPRIFLRFIQAAVAAFIWRVVAGVGMAAVLIVETVVSSSAARKGWWFMAVVQMLGSVALVAMWVHHRHSHGQRAVPQLNVRRNLRTLTAGARTVHGTARNGARRLALLPAAMSTRDLFQEHQVHEPRKRRQPAPGAAPLAAPLELGPGPEVVREAGPAGQAETLPARVEPRVYRVGPQPRRVYASASGVRLADPDEMRQPTAVIDVRELPPAERRWEVGPAVAGALPPAPRKPIPLHRAPTERQATALPPVRDDA